MTNPQLNVSGDRAKELLKKWAPVLEYTSKNIRPIEDQRTRLNTACLLENQERHCLTESGINVGGTGGVYTGYSGTVDAGTNGGRFPANDDFYARGDARLPKVLIPMIRRTFPELITNEIVGVQPLAGPIGLAWALRYKYDGNHLACTADDHCTEYGAATATNPYRTFLSAGSAAEAGYNWLNTAHTGATSAGLSGNSAFTMISADQGVAALLKQFEFQANLPQMTLEIEKTAVEAGTRALATKWSLESEQDLKAMNGIDIDTEMTNVMSYELQAEIDREMVVRMIQIALNGGPGKGYSTWSPATADGRWLAERNRDFYSKIIIEANRIAVKTRRGPANFIIASPSVCAILEMLPEFNAMTVNGTVNTQQSGVAKVGTVGGRFTVYRDTRIEAQFQTGQRQTRFEYALLGYKGPEFYDTGIVYCPYIPVMVLRTQGVNDGAPRVQLRTRYAVVDNLFGASNFYHVIIVSGLGTSFTTFQNAIYL